MAAVFVFCALAVAGASASTDSSSGAPGSSGTPVDSGIPPTATPKTYYFTWYDSKPENGMNGDSIIIGNLEDTTATALVYFGSEATPRETIDLGPKDRTAVSWPNTMGGPVRVVSPSGATFVVTQRVVYGDTFNEVGAIEAKNLDTAYNFTWYDSKPENGMKGNWILVCNTGTDTAQVNITIDGDLKGTYSIAPGENVTPQYPDYMNGPVRVECTNGQPIIVSQRVLWGASFNEVIGMPDRSLDTIYYFTWYDMIRSSGMTGNWVLISNINDTPVHAQVFIGIDPTPKGTYTIQPHQSVTPNYPELKDGPVKVICTDCTGTQKIMVSQRVLFKESFEEVQGTPPAGLTEREFFGWYDFTAANSMHGNWLLIANEGLDDTIVDVFIGPSTTPIATYFIHPGDRATPQFPEVMDGPVRVLSRNNQPLMVSQRTIYKNSFNELLGLTKVDVGFPAAPGPDMHLFKLNTYWDGLLYNDRVLDVDLRVSNPGLGAALDTEVTEITATNGVEVLTATPKTLNNNIAAGGGYDNFQVQVRVPLGVTGFNLQVKARCQDADGAFYYFPA